MNMLHNSLLAIVIACESRTAPTIIKKELNMAATASSGKTAASSGQKAEQDEKLTPVEAAAEMMMGADGEEGEHAEDEGDDEETVGFEGWARVFFQARNDRSAQQILPTNSSTLARESHLFVVVDPKASELRLYPDDKDLRLIVDPPIELKYFYAVSVPGSEAGAALFLKEDDRQLHRYIFRFEFRNDSVLQPPSRPQSLRLSAGVAKYAQRSSNLKQVELKTKAAFSNQEDASDMQRAEEAKSKEAHLAYLNTTSDLIGDATTAADSFIALINAPSGQDTEDATWKRRPKRSWGPGYEDIKSVGGDQDAGSDYSSSDFESLDDDDDDEEEDIAALIEDEEATVQASGGGGAAAADGGGAGTGKVAGGGGGGGGADGGGRRGKFQHETLEQSFRRLRA